MSFCTRSFLFVLQKISITARSASITYFFPKGQDWCEDYIVGCSQYTQTWKFTLVSYQAEDIRKTLGSQKDEIPDVVKEHRFYFVQVSWCALRSKGASWQLFRQRVKVKRIWSWPRMWFEIESTPSCIFDLLQQIIILVISFLWIVDLHLHILCKQLTFFDFSMLEVTQHKDYDKSTPCFRAPTHSRWHFLEITWNFWGDAYRTLVRACQGTTPTEALQIKHSWNS